MRCSVKQVRTICWINSTAAVKTEVSGMVMCNDVVFFHSCSFINNNLSKREDVYKCKESQREYIKQKFKKTINWKINNCLCTTSWLKSYNHTDECRVWENNACVYDAWHCNALTSHTIAKKILYLRNNKDNNHWLGHHRILRSLFGFVDVLLGNM